MASVFITKDEVVISVKELEELRAKAASAPLQEKDEKKSFLGKVKDKF